MPRRCGSASILRVTACRLAPTIANPEPTIIANSARGRRISHTIASLPGDQVCSINCGKALFERIPHTVPVETGTAPTDTAKDKETSSKGNPKMLRSD